MNSMTALKSASLHSENVLRRSQGHVVQGICLQRERGGLHHRGHQRRLSAEVHVEVGQE